MEAFPHRLYNRLQSLRLYAFKGRGSRFSGSHWSGSAPFFVFLSAQQSLKIFVSSGGCSKTAIRDSRILAPWFYARVVRAGESEESSTSSGNHDKIVVYEGMHILTIRRAIE